MSAGQAALNVVAIARDVQVDLRAEDLVVVKLMPMRVAQQEPPQAPVQKNAGSVSIRDNEKKLALRLIKSHY